MGQIINLLRFIKLTFEHITIYLFIYKFHRLPLEFPTPLLNNVDLHPDFCISMI